MSDEKCCCSETTDEYMDLLTNNYMIYDDMYERIMKPRTKENYKKQVQEEHDMRPMYDYQDETPEKGCIDYDDLIKRCKNGEYNPYCKPIGEMPRYCGASCNKDCNKHCGRTNYDMDEFYVPSRANEEEDYMDTDIDYMKSMYPREAKKVLRLVEEECDKLEYAGSCMFDEYPDRTNLGKIVIRIYEKIKDLGQEDKEFEDNEVKIEQLCQGRFCPYNRCKDCHDDGTPNWLYQLIQTTLYQEMLNRRRRYRYRRWR